VSPDPAGLSNGSARSMLLTVLGELVFPIDQPVWTSSLLYVLTGIGIEERTARQAIARGAAAGWITGERHGREVRFTLTPSGRALIEAGAERVYSVGADDGPWDGRWLVLMVTIPQSARAVRRKLYGALRWAGFGNPTPSVWLSPHLDREAEARRIVDGVGLSESTLSFVGRAASIGLDEKEIVHRAWDLEEVAAHYEDLLRRVKGLRPRAGDPLLFTHVQLVNEWQRFPFLDPQLPEELLPNWIGRRTARIFRDRREQWSAAALARWAEVMASTPRPESPTVGATTARRATSDERDL
jgi:phenylacetic acid degradation operon negative regulatory protein